MCGTVQTARRRGGQILTILHEGTWVALQEGHDGTENGVRPAPLDPAAFRFAASPRSLVLGFGNILLGDDGAGVHLVRRLESDRELSGCEFIDGGTMSFSLLNYVEAASSMLVVDTAELQRAPGTVALFDGLAMDNFLKDGRRRAVHEVGLIDLLDMARLRDRLPPRRALLCVQPGPVAWSQKLSPQVEEALLEAAALAAALLALWAMK
jgi:hydrogenase maturation protease